MVTFTHLEEGTSEDVWLADDRLRTAPQLHVDLDALVVVAAHPDDETLGAAGLIRRVHESGGSVTVVVATDGEASHPNSMSHTRADLSGVRRGEVMRAVHALAPGARIHFLAFPDGGLRENAPALDEALGCLIDTACGMGAAEGPAAAATEPCRTLIVAPWSGDGHRDHRITAESVARVAGQRGLRHLGYPIWLWHWGVPDDIPWDAGLALALTPGERSIKARALRTHASQLQPLSDAPGDEPVVSESMRAHFTRDTELFFVEAVADVREAAAAPEEAQTLPAAFFDEFYARHDDPWGFETRWYEQRKRALLLASFPSPHLGRVLEIGCSTGLITAELAERADHVVAMDASRAALDAARRRIGADRRVTLQHGAAPADWPAGAFETIVLSEVGYYLSPRDLARTIARIDAAMTGCLVACHWRHPVADYPLSGDAVHRALRSVTTWQTLALHEEEDFVLEVFCRRLAVSVAHREGLR